MERDILSKLAAHLKVHVDSGRLSFLPVYLSTLSRLRALDLEVARGAQVRARSRWVEEGESSSAYFFRLEKKNGTDRNISALRASNGTLVTDKDGLCDVSRSFYLDLFSAAPCESNARAELLQFFLFMIVRGAKVFSARRSVLLLFRAWPVVKLLVVMAFPWNSI